MASIEFLNCIEIFLIFLVILCFYGICYFVLSLITDFMGLCVFKLGTLIWTPEEIEAFTTKFKKEK